MSSRKARSESPRVVFTTGLTNHLKLRLPADEPKRESKASRSSRLAMADAGRGHRVEPENARPKAGTKLEGPIKPEPAAGWVTRGEALALLELDDETLVDLIKSYKLSRNWVEVFSKAEILALRTIVKALR